MRVMDIYEDSKFRPGDFSNNNYDGVAVFNRKGKLPVFIMMSKHCEPAHYLVVDETKQMYFLHYSEAIDYCKEKGYAPSD